MNSKISKTSNLHRLLLNITDKINLKRSDKYVALLNFSVCYTWKNIKTDIRLTKSKFKLQHGIKNLNYYILYQIFEVFLYSYLKTRRKNY